MAMDFVIDVFNSDDEEDHELHVQTTTQSNPKYAVVKNELKAVFDSQLSRRIEDLEKNPFTAYQGTCMQRQHKLILQLMIRASETSK